MNQILQRQKNGLAASKANHALLQLDLRKAYEELLPMQMELFPKGSMFVIGKHPTTMMQDGKKIHGYNFFLELIYKVPEYYDCKHASEIAGYLQMGLEVHHTVSCISTYTDDFSKRTYVKNRFGSYEDGHGFELYVLTGGDVEVNAARIS